MRGYGLPRHDDVKNPDKADILHFGLKGFRMKSKTRKTARRRWKKIARRIGRRICGTSTSSSRRWDKNI